MNSRSRSSVAFDGIGIGIEEDVEVIESGDKLGRPALKHAIAENVAGHVADAANRERLLLDIHPEIRGNGASRIPRFLGR